jgi:hypothetical protein
MWGDGDMAQQLLPSKFEAQSSNPSTGKNKIKRIKNKTDKNNSCKGFR